MDVRYAQYFYTGATLVSLMGHRAGVWLFDWMMPGTWSAETAGFGVDPYGEAVGQFSDVDCIH